LVNSNQQISELSTKNLFIFFNIGSQKCMYIFKHLISIAKDLKDKAAKLFNVNLKDKETIKKI
jgi:hypothetical protein